MFFFSFSCFLVYFIIFVLPVSHALIATTPDTHLSSMWVLLLAWSRPTLALPFLFRFTCVLFLPPIIIIMTVFVILSQRSTNRMESGGQHIHTQTKLHLLQKMHHKKGLFGVACFFFMPTSKPLVTMCCGAFQWFYHTDLPLSNTAVHSSTYWNLFLITCILELFHFMSYIFFYKEFIAV